MRFQSRRFLTRGVDSTIPLPLQLQMWGMIEHIPSPDYLQVFTLTGKNGEQHITTPAGKFMLTVFAAVAELERGYILDRQREGIAIAKAHGKYTGRKPVEVDEQLWDSLYGLWSEGKITAVEFMGRMNMRKSTFYRRINAVER